MIFIAATADEKIRAFEKSLGTRAVGTPASRRRLRHAEHLHDRRPAIRRDRRRRQRQERDEVRRLDHCLRAAAGSPADGAGRASSPAPAADGWINLFDGTSLNGWVHMNGAHRFTVEDGAIVGRTVEVQREPELVPVHAPGVRRFRARARDRDRSGHQFRHPDPDAGASGRDAGTPLRGRGRPRERAAGRDSPDLQGAAGDRPHLRRSDGHELADVASRRSRRDIRTSSTTAGTRCGSSPTDRGSRRG